MKTQAGCRLSSLKTQLNAVRRSNACKVLGGTEYLEDESMDNPLISVIIPVYNVEKYLRECVDSVLNQTYDNFEIILIDDGSTDSSGKICDEYAYNDARITVVHKENEGQSVARNIGIEYSSGDWLYFPDSDDYIAGDTFETLLKKAVTEKADIVIFDAYSFSDDGSKVRQSYISKKDYPACSGKEMFSALQKNGDFHCPLWSMFYNGDFLRKSNIRMIPGIIYEDSVFGFQIMMQASRIAHERRTFYFRRYRSGSTMTQPEKRYRHFHSRCEVYRAVRDFCRENGFADKDYAKEYIIRCAMNAVDTFRLVEKSEKGKCKNEFEIIKKEIKNDGYYDDKLLQLRCSGYVFWAAGKAVKKVFG